MLTNSYMEPRHRNLCWVLGQKTKDFIAVLEGCLHTLL